MTYRTTEHEQVRMAAHQGLSHVSPLQVQAQRFGELMIHKGARHAAGALLMFQNLSPKTADPVLRPIIATLLQACPVCTA
jgi:hypothetical protein